MYEVTVEADFSSGHYLRNYHGRCENPHGHNYKVRVTLSGAELDATGLLLDFKQLKQVMRPVIDRIDHQMLNDLEPFTTINPSAENPSEQNVHIAALPEGVTPEDIEKSEKEAAKSGNEKETALDRYNKKKHHREDKNTNSIINGPKVKKH